MILVCVKPFPLIAHDMVYAFRPYYPINSNRKITVLLYRWAALNGHPGLAESHSISPYERILCGPDSHQV